MKRAIFILMIIFFCFPNSIRAYEFELYSKNAILYNLDEGKVLYQKNEREEISIASMTKIMTAVIALEHLNSLDDSLVFQGVNLNQLEQENASVAGFYLGEKITYRDLLYGLLLPSGADAAQMLTLSISGNQTSFVMLMNAKAKELGLNNTHFQNETGLDQKDHYSSVEDVAKLFSYALQNPEFKTIISTKTYQTSDHKLLFRSTAFKNVEKYHLGMEYLVGGKTGTTNKAGLCLASIASFAGTNYLLVTARAPYPNTSPYHLLDAKQIYEYFMNHYQNQIIVKQGEPLFTLNTKYANPSQVSFYADQTIIKYLPKNITKDELSFSYDGISTLTPNIKKGAKLGTYEIKYREEVLTSFDIFLKEELVFSLWNTLIGSPFFVLFIIISILLTFLLLKNKRKKHVND